MTALPLEPHTEAEEATPARFEGAEPAEESAVEKVARELYRQWREDSGGDPADLPDWERLNEDCDDEDEPDPRGAYRRRAVLVLTAVRPSSDSEADVIRAAIAAPVAQAGEGR